MENAKTLSKNASIVQKALNAHGLAFQVLELPSSTRTANEAAASIGCNVAQIVKSLLFKTKNTNAPVLILVSGANRVDEKIVEQISGLTLEKAEATYTKDITGFAIGGIPPVGHKRKIHPIFIDQDLLKFDTVWAAAGTPHAVFSLPSKDLALLTQGKVIPIK